MHDYLDDRIMIVIIMIFTIHIVFIVVHDQIYFDIVLKAKTGSTNILIIRLFGFNCWHQSLIK